MNAADEIRRFKQRLDNVMSLREFGAVVRVARTGDGGVDPLDQRPGP